MKTLKSGASHQEPLHPWQCDFGRAAPPALPKFRAELHLFRLGGKPGDWMKSRAGHRSAVAYAVAKAEVEELAPGGRQLLASHFTFDPAQGARAQRTRPHAPTPGPHRGHEGDVFGALCRGASVVAPRRAAVLGALQEVLQGMRVSHATMTPTQWALKGSGDLPDLQHLTLCGEPMRRDTIDSWASKVQLRNMYGVTEATGVQTFHRMRAGDSAKLVGKALPGYLLGLTQENEVLVAGKGLARGYLGLEEETARCFVPWDLLTDDIEADGRAYRTGDLASWSAEKGFELHGRRDHQVKISGVRIESLEIELAVEASGLVESCTCMVQNDQLVAHCVLSSTMDWVLRAALEAHAAKRLPLQVVPHFFVGHEKLPLAPGGKVDRQALMASDLQEEPELEALGTPLEVAVATAWAKVLQRPAHSIGANSNFQWLGGDSLAALRASRGLAEEVLLPEDSVSESQEQAGEAGLMVSSEAPEGAVCVLRAALGPLAPCELLARPMLRQYATFLASKGVRDKGASQVSCATETGTLPELALIAAAGDGREAVVKALLEVPLIAAATAGHIGCAQLLLSARAHVRAMTSARTSAAHVAAARGDPSLLQLLLTTGDNDEREGIATWARDADQQTVLHLSARSGDLKCLELILSKVKGLKAKDGGLEAKDRWGRTALQWAVANGHKDAAVCLIRNGAYSKNLPDALLEDLEVNLTAPSKPGQPTALRKVVQPAERMGVLVQSLPQGRGWSSVSELLSRRVVTLLAMSFSNQKHRERGLVAEALPSHGPMPVPDAEVFGEGEDTADEDESLLARSKEAQEALKEGDQTETCFRCCFCSVVIVFFCALSFYAGTIWEAAQLQSSSLEEVVNTKVQDAFTEVYSEPKHWTVAPSSAAPTAPPSIAAPSTAPPRGTTTTTTTTTTSPASEMKTGGATMAATEATSVETEEKALACLQLSFPQLTHITYPTDAESHFLEVNETLSHFFAPNFQPHVWAGYSGPWVENHWIWNFSQRWRSRPEGTKLRDIFGPFIPIFAPFVDLVVRQKGYPMGMMECTGTILNKTMRKDVLYITVSQHDLGLFKSARNNRMTQAQMPNLLVLSAGGNGHVPIPLLKKPEKRLMGLPLRSRRYFTSFVGSGFNNKAVRETMKKVTEQWAQQTGKEVFISLKTMNEWQDILTNTTVALSPRGFGRSSFRSGELFQMGRVPIYIWDDEPWLYYRELWEKEVIGFATNIKSLGSTLDRVVSDMSKLELIEANILRMRESHFTYEGIMDQISKFMTGRNGGSDLRCQKLPRRRRRLRRRRLGRRRRGVVLQRRAFKEVVHV
ncbi:unnamed protein product [Durusdinium trenchii]|uniref:Uncharacterized protein n=1 Tax=Durusdinium trenchii TaxID=1381693 RepID=A0ABP0Q7T4_9DINO